MRRLFGCFAGVCAFGVAQPIVAAVAATPVPMPAIVYAGPAPSPPLAMPAIAYVGTPPSSPLAMPAIAYVGTAPSSPLAMPPISYHGNPSPLAGTGPASSPP